MPASAYSKHITISIGRDANTTDAADDGGGAVGRRGEFGGLVKEQNKNDNGAMCSFDQGFSQMGRR